VVSNSVGYLYINSQKENLYFSLLPYQVLDNLLAGWWFQYDFPVHRDYILTEKASFTINLCNTPCADTAVASAMPIIT